MIHLWKITDKSMYKQKIKRNNIHKKQTVKYSYNTVTAKVWNDSLKWTEADKTLM